MEELIKREGGGVVWQGLHNAAPRLLHLRVIVSFCGLSYATLLPPPPLFQPLQAHSVKEGWSERPAIPALLSSSTTIAKENKQWCTIGVLYAACHYGHTRGTGPGQTGTLCLHAQLGTATTQAHMCLSDLRIVAHLGEKGQFCVLCKRKRKKKRNERRKNSGTVFIS